MSDFDAAIPGVTWNDDGSAAITLKAAINVGGAKTAQLRMECPSAAEAEELAADDRLSERDRIKREVLMIARLCGVADAEIRQLRMPDFLRVQGVYRSFFVGSAPNFQF